MVCFLKFDREKGVGLKEYAVWLTQVFCKLYDLFSNSFQEMSILLQWYQIKHVPVLYRESNELKLSDSYHDLDHFLGGNHDILNHIFITTWWDLVWKIVGNDFGCPIIHNSYDSERWNNFWTEVDQNTHNWIFEKNSWKKGEA